MLATSPDKVMLTCPLQVLAADCVDGPADGPRSSILLKACETTLHPSTHKTIPDQGPHLMG